MISAVGSANVVERPRNRVRGQQPAAGPDRRGALRPDVLASPRARMEAAATGRAFRAVEAAAILLFALVACRVANPEGLLAAPLAAALPFLVGAPALVFSLRGARAFTVRSREPLARSLARASGALLLTGSVLAALVMLLPLDERDVAAAGAWFALCAVTICGLRVLWWRRVQRLRRAGKLTPNIVVVGATPNAARLIAQARDSGDAAVLGVFDDRIGRSPGEVCGVPVLGGTAALLNHRIMPYVDRVVITVPARAQGRVRQLIERLRVLPNEVSLFLDTEGETQPAALLSRLADTPLAQVSGHRLEEAHVLSKRVQDLVLGSLALIVAAPVMLAVALAVRLDSPGPIFFRQRRHGFNNEEIVVWKFRSMRHEAADADGARQVRANDDRVTRVGAFIRRTSLDELPQLFNVLRGEMSLVGPRPHAIGMKTGDEESHRLVAEYAHRHRMKPGVTGWAAIHGSRGPVDTAAEVRRRVALDVEYIERHSVWLDLYILLMTLPCLMGDRDAVR